MSGEVDVTAASGPGDWENIREEMKHDLQRGHDCTYIVHAPWRFSYPFLEVDDTISYKHGSLKSAIARINIPLIGLAATVFVSDKRLTLVTDEINIRPAKPVAALGRMSIVQARTVDPGQLLTVKHFLPYLEEQ